MSDSHILSRLRIFLLVVSGVLFTGSLLELLLIEHWEDPIQFIPFALCGLGVVAVLLVLLRQTRRTLLALQMSMGLVLLGSLFGIYEHISNNFAFELEIRPNAAMTDAILQALGGANPLLAPGVLGLAAILAVAAVYHHPALRTNQ